MNNEPKPLHSVIVNAVVMNGDIVLITQRAATEGHEPLKWAIPGGKVELTDGDVFNILEDTALREVMEETGITAANPKMFMNNTFIKANGQHTIAIIFKCEYVSGEPTTSEETEQVLWIKKEDLQNYEFAPNVKKYIEIAIEF